MGKAKRLRAQRGAASPPLESDDPATPSHLLKLQRARTHLDELQEQVSRFLDRTQESVDREPDPEMASHQRIWVTAESPPRDPFSLLLGDCLQNLRSALDHLAFELATAFTPHLPDDIAKQSEFPIFGNEKGDGSTRFHRRLSKGSHAGDPAPGSGLAKTQGMDPCAQQVIEGLQPYARGASYEADPLWRTHELNRLDKHRLLHTAVANNGGMAFAITPETADAMKAALLGGPGRIDNRTGEIHGRTYVGSAPIHGNPSEQVRAAYGPNLEVTFEQAVPLVGGEPVLRVLADLYNYVLTDVLPPLSGFLK